MSHTPAPWKVVTQKTEWDDGDLGVAVDSGVIAEVWSKSWYDDEDHSLPVEANAHLIASAPELLEALKTLRSFMWKEGYADIVPAMAKADVVIRKATGGTQ